VHILTPAIVPYHERARVRRLNEALLRTEVSRAMRRTGLTRPILWAYVPQALALVDVLRPRLVVYHCVDDIGAHDRVDTRTFRRAEHEFVRAADLVIASSEPLRARLADETENVRLMTNVADTDAFSRALQPGPVDPAIESLPHPRIVFVGAVSSIKVDVELVCEVARERPTWSIALVGPVGLGDPRMDVSALRAESNIHLLGTRPHDLLPTVLRGADAAIIPYRINELTSSVFPMKVYEYLAAGLPTVATPLPALVGVDGIETAAGAQQTAALLERLIDEDTDKIRRRRSELASGHSWSARIDEIERAFGELEWRR
jgi:glycosyltransferase involved in cell wall biosynthesis